MAEHRKFAGARGRLKQQPRQAARSLPSAQAIEERPAAVLSISSAAAEPPSKGRRAGKRSDPAYRPTTFYVRKETQRKAARLLEDQDTGKDLSDLVQELLSKWIADNSNA